MFITSRRALLVGASSATALALAGCVSTTAPGPVAQIPAPPPPTPEATPVAMAALQPKYSAMYGPVTGEPFPLPAVKLSAIDPAFLRKEVAYATKEPPGTIVIDPAHHYLYSVEAGGRAMRYGVGVGREGFLWSGEATIKSKQEWPDWYPPKEMIARQPEDQKGDVAIAERHRHARWPAQPARRPRHVSLAGQHGHLVSAFTGRRNPGPSARACHPAAIRMINQDAIDLYQRARPKARASWFSATPTPTHL